MENAEENCEKRWQIQKYATEICCFRLKFSVFMSKNGEWGKKSKLNSEMIWKIWKKVSRIVIRYVQYERKESWIVIRFGKYGRKVEWIVKWYGKYGRKEGKYMKNPEENSDTIGKIKKKLWTDMENMEERQVQ